jgi:hypothetical protein
MMVLIVNYQLHGARLLIRVFEQAHMPHAGAKLRECKRPSHCTFKLPIYQYSILIVGAKNIPCIIFKALIIHRISIEVAVAISYMPRMIEPQYDETN